MNISNSKLTPSSAKEIAKRIILGNINDQQPLTFNIEGLPGIAKTSICEQAVSEINNFIRKNKNIELSESEQLESLEENFLIKTCSIFNLNPKELKEFHYIKLNLANYSPEDLLGYPVVEFKVQKFIETNEHYEEGVVSKVLTEKWISKELIDIYTNKDWELTGEHRMEYSLPAWLQPYLNTGNPIVLNLDDFNRGNPAMSNAIMELCETMKFGNWSLPKNSTIILTSNPDTGDFNVTSGDSAQKTRMITYEMLFSINDWANHALKTGIDEILVDFLKKNTELIQGSTKVTKTEKINSEEEELDDLNNDNRPNSRIWTKYFKVLSKFTRAFSEKKIDKDDLIKIFSNFAGKSIPANYVLLLNNHFFNLIEQLMTPEELIYSDNIEETLKTFKERSLNTSGQPRMDYIGIVYRRLNIALGKNSHIRDFNEKESNNIISILKSEIFSSDLLLSLIKTCRNNPNLKQVNEDKGLLIEFANRLSGK